MAQGRIAVVTHSRSQGHSAVAALAYRAGAALDDERTGERHDYTWRADADIVAWSGLIGDGAEAFGGDLAAFANMVERRETRENARIGRDLQISLPDELSMGDQIRLARTFAHTVSHRYSTPCHLAVHHPGSGDNRNRHAHLFLPTRTWAGGEFGRKLRVLDDRVSGPREITALREMYEGSTNRALERAGLDERIDISWQPDAQPRLGAKATAAERAAAAAQGIDAHGMAMSELVCRVTAPVTPQGQALREHQTRAIELEREIERDQAESRAQLGPLYDAQPLEPHVAVAPAAPERRRRRRRRAPAALTPAPTTMAVQPPEAGTPRRRPTAAAVPAIASQETPNAPYAPARRRRRRRRAPAALTPAPTTMAVQPPEAGTPRRRPTAAAVPAIASQETPNAPYAPARRRRRRRRAPAALTPAPTTMAVQPPEADTPRRRPTAAAVPAAPQETPNTTHAPARRRRSGRRRAPAALTPTPTMVVRSPEADTPRRRPTAAAVPAVAPQETPHQSIDAADLQLLSDEIPPTIAEIGTAIATERADDDLAMMHDEADGHHGAQAVLAAACAAAAVEHKRKHDRGEPVYVIQPDRGDTSMFVKWINERLTMFRDAAARFRRGRDEHQQGGEPTLKRAGPGAPQRPTITVGRQSTPEKRPRRIT